MSEVSVVAIRLDLRIGLDTRSRRTWDQSLSTFSLLFFIAVTGFPVGPA